MNEVIPMNMNNEAHDLAQAFIDSKSGVPETFTVRIAGSSDVVVVAVGRVPSYREDRAVKSLEESLRFIPMPSGSRCPTCGGTGRV